MSEGEQSETGVGLLAPGGVAAFLKKLASARHVETSQAATRCASLVSYSCIDTVLCFRTGLLTVPSFMTFELP